MDIYPFSVEPPGSIGQPENDLIPRIEINPKLERRLIDEFFQLWTKITRVPAKLNSGSSNGIGIWVA